MPRRADHEARRAQIVEALLRQAAREGLHRVSMRTVAAEAGVSLRLVQYYFGDKHRLLLGALEHLERESNARWQRRLAELPDPAPPRAVLDAFVAEALPDDRPSRDFHQLFSAFAALAMTDPRLAGQPYLNGPRELHRTLTEVIRDAEVADAAGRATHLQALTHGLATGVLIGHLTLEEARRVSDRHLDSLLPVSKTSRAGHEPASIPDPG